MTAVLLCISCSLASATELVRPRPLTEYADILLAQELDTTIVTLNEHISKCIEAGSGNSSECYCRYPAEADAAKMAYEKILKARPKWKGKVLFWKDAQNTASYSLIMPAIESMLQLPVESCGSGVQH